MHQRGKIFEKENEIEYKYFVMYFWEVEGATKKDKSRRNNRYKHLLLLDSNEIQLQMKTSGFYNFQIFCMKINKR